MKYEDSAIVLLNLSNIISKLAEEPGWNVKYATRASEQYKRFLFLMKKYEDQKAIVPSKDIDMFWHQHILATKQYQEDCEKVFGRYLHHLPFLKRQAANQDNTNHFQITQKLYHEEFGEYILNVRPLLFWRVTSKIVMDFFYGISNIFKKIRDLRFSQSYVN